MVMIISVYYIVVEWSFVIVNIKGVFVGFFFRFLIEVVWFIFKCVIVIIGLVFIFLCCSFCGDWVFIIIVVVIKCWFVWSIFCLKI